MGYRAQTAPRTVADAGSAHAADEELGIVRTDDTIGKIAADARQESGETEPRDAVPAARALNISPSGAEEAPRVDTRF